MKVRFYNISWDTDSQEVNELPEETTLTVDDDICVEADGADVLSYEYGFCVESFNFEIV